MSKFPAWFPTRNEVNAFLASKPDHRLYPTDGVVEQDRHRRITWAAHQALAWANANPIADKDAILRKIHDVLNPINWKVLMEEHPATTADTKPQFTMTNHGVERVR